MKLAILYDLTTNTKALHDKCIYIIEIIKIKNKANPTRKKWNVERLKVKEDHCKDKILDIWTE